MNDYYLRAADEPSMMAALGRAGLVAASGRIADGISIAVIGRINRPTGDLLPDGDPVMVPVHGWHVNIRSQNPLERWQMDELPIIQKPGTPERAWFDHAA